MISQIISECISSLFRLGTLVRQLSPPDRFQQALRNSDLACPDSFDIDHVAQKYPKLCNNKLLERFGSAITKRRQFIRYSGNHRPQLGMIGATGKATAAERLSSLATTFLPHSNMEGKKKNDIFLTSASKLPDHLLDLTLPRLVDIAKVQKTFECPICFTPQSFESEKLWQYVQIDSILLRLCLDTVTLMIV